MELREINCLPRVMKHLMQSQDSNSFLTPMLLFGCFLLKDIASQNKVDLFSGYLGVYLILLVTSRNADLSEMAPGLMETRR